MAQKQAMYDYLADSEKTVKGKTTITVPGYYSMLHAINDNRGEGDDGSLESKVECHDPQEDNFNYPLKQGREWIEQPHSSTHMIHRLRNQEITLQNRTAAVQNMLQHVDQAFGSHNFTPVNLRYYAAQARILQEMLNDDDNFSEDNAQALCDFIDSRSIMLPSQVELLRFKREIMDISSRREQQRGVTESEIFRLKQKAFKRARSNLSKDASDIFLLHRRGWICLRRLFIFSKFGKAVRDVGCMRRSILMRRALQSMHKRTVQSLHYHVRSYLRILRHVWNRFSNKIRQELRRTDNVAQQPILISVFRLRKKALPVMNMLLQRSRHRCMQGMQAELRHEHVSMRLAFRRFRKEALMEKMVLMTLQNVICKQLRIGYSALRIFSNNHKKPRAGHNHWRRKRLNIIFTKWKQHTDFLLDGRASQHNDEVQARLEKGDCHYEDRGMKEMIAVWLWRTSLALEQKKFRKAIRRAHLKRYGISVWRQWRARVQCLVVQRNQCIKDKSRLKVTFPLRVRRVFRCWRDNIKDWMEERMAQKVASYCYTSKLKADILRKWIQRVREESSSQGTCTTAATFRLRYTPRLAEVRRRHFMYRWVSHTAAFQQLWPKVKVAAKFRQVQLLRFVVNTLRERVSRKVWEDDTIGVYRHQVQSPMLLGMVMNRWLHFKRDQVETRTDSRCLLRQQRMSWVCWQLWRSRVNAVAHFAALQQLALSYRKRRYWVRFSANILQLKDCVERYSFIRRDRKTRRYAPNKGLELWKTKREEHGWDMLQAGLTRLRAYKMLCKRGKEAYNRKLLRKVFGALVQQLSEDTLPFKRGRAAWATREGRLTLSELRARVLRFRHPRNTAMHHAQAYSKQAHLSCWVVLHRRVIGLRHAYDHSRDFSLNTVYNTIMVLLHTVSKNRRHLRVAYQKGVQFQNKRIMQFGLLSWSSIVWSRRHDAKIGMVKTAKTARMKEASNFHLMRRFQQAVEAFLRNYENRSSLKHQLSSALEAVTTVRITRSVTQWRLIVQSQHMQKGRQMTGDAYWLRKYVGESIAYLGKNADRRRYFKLAVKTFVRKCFKQSWGQWKKIAPPVPFRSIRLGNKTLKGKAVRAALKKWLRPRVVVAKKLVQKSPVPKEALSLSLSLSLSLPGLSQTASQSSARSSFSSPQGGKSPTTPRGQLGHSVASSPPNSGRSSMSTSSRAPHKHLSQSQSTAMPVSSSLLSAATPARRGSGSGTTKGKGISFAAPALCAPQPLSLQGDFRYSRQMEMMQLAEDVRPWYSARMTMMQWHSRASCRSDMRKLVKEYLFGRLSKVLQRMSAFVATVMKQQHHVWSMTQKYHRYHTVAALKKWALYRRMKRAFYAVRKKWLSTRFLVWRRKERNRKLMKKVTLTMVSVHQQHEISAYFREWKIDNKVESVVGNYSKVVLERSQRLGLTAWMGWLYLRSRRRLWFRRSRNNRLERLQRGVLKKIFQFLDKKYKAAEKVAAAGRWYKDACRRSVLNNLLWFRRNRIATDFKKRNYFKALVSALRLNSSVCKYNNWNLRRAGLKILKKLIKRWRLHLVLHGRFLFRSFDVLERKKGAIDAWRNVFWLQCVYRFLGCHLRSCMRQRYSLDRAGSHHEDFKLHCVLRRFLAARRRKRKERARINAVDEALKELSAKKALHRLDCLVSSHWAGLQKLRLMSVYARQAALARGLRALLSPVRRKLSHHAVSRV